MGTSIRALLWDADGVLQMGVSSWPGVFADAIGTGAEEFGVAVWGELGAALSGDLDMAAHVDQVIDDQDLAERRDAILEVWSMIDPLPATRGLVAEIRAAGTPCYLATNQDNLRAAAMRQRMEYDALLDGAYYSCELGIAKPEQAFFLRIADDLALAPRELFFVDDQPENVEAAREVGLAAELWHHDHGVEVLRARLSALGVL